MVDSISPAALDKVFARARRDRYYRGLLQKNPHLAIRDASGERVSTRLRIRFVEKSPDVDLMIILPDLEPSAREVPEPDDGTAAAGVADGTIGDVFLSDRERDVFEVQVVPDRDALIRACAQQCPGHGLVLEFGVFQGESLRQLQAVFGGLVIGYDSFQGLPESWHRGSGRALPAGYFSCDPPRIPGTELVIGLFEDTVAMHLASREQPVRFAHIDCDLYSSCRTVLQALTPWLQVGTVLLFDELAAFETSAFRNWREGEWRALQESGLKYRPIGRTRHSQCAIQVTGWD